jgi:hypothetical protein
MMWDLTQTMRLSSHVAINSLKNVWRLKNLLYLCGVQTMNVCRKRGRKPNTSKDGDMGMLGNPKTQPLRV